MEKQILIKFFGIIFILIMLSNFSYSQTENKQSITNDTIIKSLDWKVEYGISQEKWNKLPLEEQEIWIEDAGFDAQQAATDQYNRMVEEYKKLTNDTIQKKK